METRMITTNKPDVFSYIGLFSGALYAPDEVKNKSKVNLIFQSCGSKERPEDVKKATEKLKEAGINAVSYISEGTAHEFHTWRRSLHQFAQLLFRD
jgi:S-formylglutathione hydrolase FrmB